MRAKMGKPINTNMLGTMYDGRMGYSEEDVNGAVKGLKMAIRILPELTQEDTDAVLTIIDDYFINP